MIRHIVFIGLGGGLGSIIRYLTSLAIRKFYQGNYPLATLIANIAGCFIIGVIIGIFSKHSPTNENIKLFFATGFCGGYTTFSTFAAENTELIANNNYIEALSYMLLSIILGISFVFLGIVLTK